MTDRELLILAAKAAGVEWVEDGGIGYYRIDGGLCCDDWNPLKSDGDALRLAVKLSVHVKICRRVTMVEMRDDGDDLTESHGNDPYAATRRAIVRAAAAIGEKL